MEHDEEKIGKRSKFRSILLVIIIIILLVGFIIISLIMRDLLEILSKSSEVFIEFIRDFLSKIENFDRINFRGVNLFQT